MILIAGGTGLLGRSLTSRLDDRQQRIRILTRDPAAATGLCPESVELVKGDLRDDASVAAAMEGVTTVVAAAHGLLGPRGESPASIDRDGNARLVDAARSVGADVVLMSIVGASVDHPVELFRMKHAAEQHLLAAGIGWTIVRATAYTELWVGILRETSRRRGRPLVFGRGESPHNFVSVVDVAALLETAVRDPSLRGQVLEIGGPDNLSMNELAGLVQQADHLPGPLRHVPPTVLRLMAATVGRVSPQLGRQATMSLHLDSSDDTFDDGPIHLQFPHLPRTAVSDVLQASASP